MAAILPVTASPLQAVHRHWKEKLLSSKCPLSLGTESVQPQSSGAAQTSGRAHTLHWRWVFSAQAL